MKYLAAYIALSVACFTSKEARAGSSDSLSLFRKAGEYYSAGQYYKAGVYFHKAEFFFNNRLAKLNCCFNSADAYKAAGNYSEALQVLSPVRIEGLHDSLVFRLKYQCALLAFLSGDFGLSESHLTQIEYFVHDSNLVYSSYLLKTLSLNEQTRWLDAQTCMKKLNRYLNSGDPANLKTGERIIDSLYAGSVLPKLKNKRKAVNLSSVVPGLGQCYAGSVGEGILSFSSVLVCSAGMVVGILNQYYFTSIFFGNMLIGKFYQGGLRRTEYLVDKRNYKRAKGFNENLRQELVSRYK